jgi:hypothetical protein
MPNADLACQPCGAPVALDDAICANCGALLAAYRITIGAAAVPEPAVPTMHVPLVIEPRSTSPIGDALRQEQERWLRDRVPIELPVPTRPHPPMRARPVPAPVSGNDARTHRRMAGANLLAHSLRTSADGRRRDIVIASSLIFGFSCLFLPAGPILGVVLGVILAITLNAMAPIAMPGLDADDDRGVPALFRFMAFCVIVLVPITLVSPISPVERVSGIASLLAILFLAYRISRNQGDGAAREPFEDQGLLVTLALAACAVVGLAMLAGGLLFDELGMATGKSVAIAGLVVVAWGRNRGSGLGALRAGER